MVNKSIKLSNMASDPKSITNKSLTATSRKALIKKKRRNNNNHEYMFMCEKKNCKSKKVNKDNNKELHKFCEFHKDKSKINSRRCNFRKKLKKLLKQGKEDSEEYRKLCNAPQNQGFFQMKVEAEQRDTTLKINNDFIMNEPEDVLYGFEKTAGHVYYCSQYCIPEQPSSMPMNISHCDISTVSGFQTCTLNTGFSNTMRPADSSNLVQNTSMVYPHLSGSSYNSDIDSSGCFVPQQDSSFYSESSVNAMSDIMGTAHTPVSSSSLLCDNVHSQSTIFSHSTETKSSSSITMGYTEPFYNTKESTGGVTSFFDSNGYIKFDEDHEASRYEYQTFEIYADCPTKRYQPVDSFLVSQEINGNKAMNQCEEETIVEMPQFATTTTPSEKSI